MTRVISQLYTVTERNWDLYGVFLERALRLGRGGRGIGVIVPSRVASNLDMLPVRELLYDAEGPSHFIDCGMPFRAATVEAGIIIHAPGPSNEITVGVFRNGDLSEVRQVDRSIAAALPDVPFPVRLWPRQIPILAKLTDLACRIGDVLEVHRGMECGTNDSSVLQTAGTGTVPVVSGEGVRTFSIVPQGLFIHLGLEPARKYKSPELFTRTPKVLLRFVAPVPVAAVDTEGIANFNTVYNIYGIESDGDVDCYAVAAWLNSSPVRWWFSRVFASEEDVFPHIQKYQIQAIPIAPQLITKGGDLARIGRALTERDAADREGLWSKLDGVVAAWVGITDSEMATVADELDGRGWDWP